MEEEFRFLYLEDDTDMIQLVKKVIGPLGTIHSATNIKDAIECLEKTEYHLILIDVLLKNESGFDFIQILKQKDFSFQPHLIVLSSSTDEEDEVKSHELAIDEYIRKPLRPKAFAAQMKKYVSDFKEMSSHEKEVGGLRINFTRQEVTLTSSGVQEVVRLPHKEYKLLLALIQNHTKPITREQLFTDVWEAHPALNSRTVDMHISGLKKKLGEAGNYISSIRGVGYVFKYDDHV